MADFTKLGNHFSFGENWSSSYQDISDVKVKGAQIRMKELLPEKFLAKKCSWLSVVAQK